MSIKIQNLKQGLYGRARNSFSNRNLIDRVSERFMSGEYPVVIRTISEDRYVKLYFNKEHECCLRLNLCASEKYDAFVIKDKELSDAIKVAFNCIEKDTMFARVVYENGRHYLRSDKDAIFRFDVSGKYPFLDFSANDVDKCDKKWKLLDDGFIVAQNGISMEVYLPDERNGSPMP